MILWTDFLALALVTSVVILVPQLRQLNPDSPWFLRNFVRILPGLLTLLWVTLTLLWVTQ